MNKQLIDAARTAVDALDDAAQLAFLARSCEFHVDASKYSECSELLRAALEAAQREQVSVARRPLTADVVEQRLLTWRQRLVNRSGDQLALDDFMDQQNIDDLVDFVCAEDTPPGVLDALHEQARPLAAALRRVLDTQDAADEARALAARNPRSARLERAAVAKAIKFLEARADAKALLDEGARLGVTE